MSLNSSLIGRNLIVGAALLVSFGAVAQGTSDVSGARLRWAERHAEFVCRPLEEKGEAARAARCYDRAARVRTEAGDARDATGSIVVQAAVAAPLPAPRPWCTGIRCIEKLSFPGAAY